MSEQREDAREHAAGTASAETDAPQQPPHGSAAPTRRTRRIIWASAIGIALVLGGAALYWAPSGENLPWSLSPERTLANRIADVDQRLGALAQQQAGFEGRVARLEQQVKSATADGSQQTALEQRLAALEQRVGGAAEHATALDQRVERFQDQTSASFAALRDEVEKLAAAQQGLAQSAKERGADGTDQALLLSLEPLRNAIDSARPFAPELSAMTALARDRPEVREALKPLEAVAAKGVPDTLALARRFEQEVAPAMLRAASAPREDSWTERLWSGLRSLVVIRRVDGTTGGDPTEAAVALAEKALTANDLATAVMAVEGVTARATGPVQSSAQAWLTDARERVAAETALATLRQQLTERLAAGGDKAQPR
jgi:hypothetical protein